LEENLVCHINRRGASRTHLHPDWQPEGRGARAAAATARPDSVGAAGASAAADAGPVVQYGRAAQGGGGTNANGAGCGGAPGDADFNCGYIVLKALRPDIIQPGTACAAAAMRGAVGGELARSLLALTVLPTSGVGGRRGASPACRR